MAPPSSHAAYISPAILQPANLHWASRNCGHSWTQSASLASNPYSWNRNMRKLPRRRCSVVSLVSSSTENFSNHEVTEENEHQTVSTSSHGADSLPVTYSITSETAMDSSHPDSLTALQIRDRRRVTRLLELVLPDEESTSRSTNSISRTQNIMWSDDEEAEYLRRQEYRLDHSHYNALRVDAAVKQHRTEIDALVSALEQSFDRQMHSSKLETMGLWPGTYALLYARKVAPKSNSKSKWLRESPYLRELAGTLVGLNTLRSTIARLVFKTTDRFQLLIGNRYVINMFRFRLLGTFTGCVTTRGRIQHVHSSSDGVDGEPDFHERDVKFESPRITLGRALNIRYGKEYVFGGSDEIQGSEVTIHGVSFTNKGTSHCFSLPQIISFDANYLYGRQDPCGLRCSRCALHLCSFGSGI
mmetsp:Transcript_3896/g.7063  ORF Transcript_3896/g.7063 Transcript_3896/m.7063 type:complete len:415 (-) Transcript_3896:604-1848(-)